MRTGLSPEDSREALHKLSNDGGPLVRLGLPVALVSEIRQFLLNARMRVGHSQLWYVSRRGGGQGAIVFILLHACATQGIRDKLQELSQLLPLQCRADNELVGR
eukprot:3663562-Amphidinium_carterae.1